MDSIGETLRAARHNKNVTLEDVARVTKIKLDILEKLEAEEFASLAAPMYTKGFLKIYAEYLGLDSTGIMDAYLKSQGGLRRQGLQLETDATLRSRPAVELALPIGAVIRVVAVVSAVALVGFAGYQLWAHRHALKLPVSKPVVQAAVKPAVQPVVSKPVVVPVSKPTVLPVANFEAYYQPKTKPAAAVLEPPAK